MRTTAGVAVAVLAVALAVGMLAWGVGLVELPGEDRHDAAVVTLLDGDGTTLATVDARVADSRKERIRGLSDTASLAAGEGMLFVHGDVGERTYVMREMEFPLDIVFVVPCRGDCPAGADGRIAVVHQAPVPPADAEELEPYRGRARWVLEVPRGYAAANGVEVGDYVAIRFVTAE